MGKQFGLWRSVALNLATKFGPYGRKMIESGAHDGDDVMIDFLARTVDPPILARTQMSNIAVSAYFLKHMEAQYDNTLLSAQMTVRQDAIGKTYYDVHLETSDPPDCIDGTVVHVKGLSYEWEYRPVAPRAGKAAVANRRGPGISPPQVNAPDGTAPHFVPDDHGYGGYEWLDMPAPAKGKKS